jgi:Cys-rich protein (TIGR01571 family)
MNFDNKIQSRNNTATYPGKVITAQITQDVWGFENRWTHDFCDCCSNVNQCCIAYWCFPCFLCILFDRTGQVYLFQKHCIKKINFIFLLFNGSFSFSLSLYSEFFCTPYFTPNAITALRTKIRTAFRINGK